MLCLVQFYTELLLCSEMSARAAADDSWKPPALPLTHAWLVRRPDRCVNVVSVLGGMCRAGRPRDWQEGTV